MPRVPCSPPALLAFRDDRQTVRHSYHYTRKVATSPARPPARPPARSPADPARSSANPLARPTRHLASPPTALPSACIRHACSYIRNCIIHGCRLGACAEVRRRRSALSILINPPLLALCAHQRGAPPPVYRSTGISIRVRWRLGKRHPSKNLVNEKVERYVFWAQLKNWGSGAATTFEHR